MSEEMDIEMGQGPHRNTSADAPRWQPHPRTRVEPRPPPKSSPQVTTASEEGIRQPPIDEQWTQNAIARQLETSLAQIMEKFLANDNRMGVSQPAITQPESQQGNPPA
ncbi:hypothetical protein GcC1_016045, partial [Golovinomyces cichoracearum]